LERSRAARRAAAESLRRWRARVAAQDTAGFALLKREIDGVAVRDSPLATVQRSGGGDPPDTLVAAAEARAEVAEARAAAAEAGARAAAKREAAAEKAPLRHDAFAATLACSHLL